MTAVELAKAAAERAGTKSRPAQREAAAAKFEDDFNLCMEHFNFTAIQRTEALAAARDDVIGAKACYSGIAASLRVEGKAAGLNERIRARIAAEKKAVAA